MKGFVVSGALVAGFIFVHGTYAAEPIFAEGLVCSEKEELQSFAANWDGDNAEEVLGILNADGAVCYTGAFLVEVREVLSTEMDTAQGTFLPARVRVKALVTSLEHAPPDLDTERYILTFE